MNSKDLLDKYLDYQTNWSSSHQLNSKPSKIRLEMLIALLKAFNIIDVDFSENNNTDYEEENSALELFSDGFFLEDRSAEENSEVINRIESFANKFYPVLFKLRQTYSISWLFNNLLLFRTRIHEFTIDSKGFDGGIDFAVQYGAFLQNNLQTVINENIKEIDELLCLMIDPTNKIITEKYLIDSFNYPDVNLETIDLDWIAENY